MRRNVKKPKRQNVKRRRTAFKTVLQQSTLSLRDLCDCIAQNGGLLAGMTHNEEVEELARFTRDCVMRF